MIELAGPEIRARSNRVWFLLDRAGALSLIATPLQGSKPYDGPADRRQPRRR